MEEIKRQDLIKKCNDQADNALKELSSVLMNFGFYTDELTVLRKVVSEYISKKMYTELRDKRDIKEHMIDVVNEMFEGDEE